MAVIHIVLFKFRKDTPSHILKTFVTELRKLRHEPSVHRRNLVVGGPSITTPIARSKGYDFCLVSYHANREALEEYQRSKGHHRVTSKYMWPFNEDLTRFDFEVDNDQEESSDGTPKMLEPFASLMMSQTGIEPDSQSGSDVSGHVTEDSASC